MIRINLIQEGRKIAVARSGTPSRFSLDADTAAVWCLVLTLVVGGLAYGGYWLLLNRDLGQGRDEIAVAQKRVDDLQEVLDQVDRYIARRAQLDHKIKVISELRDNQSGPVRIMDEVSKALPDLLWLDELDLSGREVSMRGRAFTTNSVASFIENLDRVPEFREPVLKSATWNGRAYAFQVSFRFRVVPIHQPLNQGTTDEGEKTGADAAVPAR